MDFSPKHAIPLSNITIFGGSIANTILNLKKQHLLADHPLIDWDLILLMQPLTIAGALMGAFLNKILPELLLSVLLVLMLAFTAYTTLKKVAKMYNAETKAIRRSNAACHKESELLQMATNKHDHSEEEAGESLLDYTNDIISPDEEEQSNEAAAKGN
jgi:uncharacterized membrane protein YfcA